MTKILSTAVILFFCLADIGSISAQFYTITGELKKWHRVTICIDGPMVAETDTPNPFADYALEVTFTNGPRSYTVPGYFAADGNAAETSATSGDQWCVHFAPDFTGTWEFIVSFTEGTDVAIEGGGTPVLPLHGTTGSFAIADTDKTGKDNRARGRLQFVGKHYLRYGERGEWFVKGGADAPENTLAYDDFDDVPDRGGRRKSWSPHAGDYDAGTAATYTWQGDKGSELLGAISYLSDSVGMNAFSFLTFSLAGDDENVFPHLLKVDIPTYNTYGDAQQWNDGVYHDRFDVSRMAQWERIFSYADLKGMYLHFKMQEQENDQKMDGGDVGRERKLYYRELIARFAHHLALNWNLGEENSQTTQQEIEMAAYISATDPYGHNIVMHTFPPQHNKYDALTGDQSELTGASIQTDIDNVHTAVKTWVANSAAAGKPWIVANDEQGGANTGVNNDPDAIDQVREDVTWGSLMAGGAGFEYYYGYQTSCTDLNCEDHRSREIKYQQAAHALSFFQHHFQGYLPDVVNADSITTDPDDYVLGRDSAAWAVYMPDGGSTSIALSPGLWITQWYNPRNGTFAIDTDTITGTLTAPDTDDWVALIRFHIDGCPSGTGVIYNLTQDVYLCSIQEAIDMASSGDIIQVASGLYQENIIIHKPLTLLSTGNHLTTVIEGSAGIPVISVQSDGVYIEGFTVRAAP